MIDGVAVGHLEALKPTLEFLDVRGCSGLEPPIRESLRALMAPAPEHSGPQKTLLMDP